MLLRAIYDQPIKALRHMERRVNDGSPSGFTGRYTTSPETSPFGETETFALHLALGQPEQFETFGQVPTWPALPQAPDESWILVHPDMATNPELNVPGLSVSLQDGYKVVPTASGRTVHYIDAPSDDYVKLHYAGILGRVDRRLPFRAAISGPEVSSILTTATADGTLHPLLAFLPETGGRVLRLRRGSGVIEWGMTWRMGQPHGQAASSIAATVPVFSLFSKDQHAESDRPLICQLIDSTGVEPKAYVLNELLGPMVRAYFSLIRDLGLQPEWNAQNLLLGVDAAGHVAAFVMRDLESVDKDLTIQKRLGLDYSFRSAPHKCIHDGQYNYQIKHSFMFDYKLGGYILEPILELIARTYNLRYDALVADVREVSDQCLASLPSDFFPEDGCWYSFAPVLIDQSKPSRPYVRNPNPPFRSTTVRP